jgi:sugar lactone lactonase YvrE
MAVSADGATLYLTDLESHVIRSYALVDGAPLAVVGSLGSEPLQFCSPRQICVAPDGFIFVAEA